jgi:hypothetical protein
VDDQILFLVEHFWQSLGGISTYLKKALPASPSKKRDTNMVAMFLKRKVSIPALSTQSH